MMEETGFRDVEKTMRFMTLYGPLSLYRMRKPDDGHSGKGYDTAGIDISEAMLKVADNKSMVRVTKPGGRIAVAEELFHASDIFVQKKISIMLGAGKIWRGIRFSAGDRSGGVNYA